MSILDFAPFPLFLFSIAGNGGVVASSFYNEKATAHPVDADRADGGVAYDAGSYSSGVNLSTLRPSWRSSMPCSQARIVWTTSPER